MSKRERNLLNLSLSELMQTASSDDWRSREDAGFERRARTEEGFDQNYSVLNAWLGHNNEYIRRAAVIGCMVRKRYGTPEKIYRLMGLLENVLDDPSAYVRRNTGPFVIGYLGYTYPDTVLPILCEWAKKYENITQPYICWNIVSAFSQALGRKHVQVALQVVRTFASHPHYIVKREVIKCLVNTAQVALSDTIDLCHTMLKSTTEQEVAKRTMEKIDSSK